MRCFECAKKTTSKHRGEEKDKGITENIIESSETNSNVQHINEQSNTSFQMFRFTIVSCSFCLTSVAPKEKKKKAG